ncbi:winged helix-turn-helix transcriptional regulator [Flexivirga meconopsidis]|uniref:winged helix-turn-helix transcriptional regulator n=1 Tax=Flexivirga meconopsidis TaxID=2977121 RepID=UPI00223F844F|nr:helix-turn-helix domain-containing protein [Flexivirga meconopsidis]
MTRVDLSEVSCSIARTVAVMSDAWSWLIVRDLAVGLGRFDELHTDLGISRKVLSQRLIELTEAGVVERRAYQEHPPRFEYQLTEQGRDLIPVLRAMVTWGDEWRPTGRGAPMRYEHASCPGSRPEAVCDVCAEPVDPDDLVPVAGPGGRHGPGTALIGGYLK